MPNDDSDQPIVTRLGKTGVFLPVRYDDPDGSAVVRMAAAVEQVKNLEAISKLSGPKFHEAIQDDVARKELHDAIKAFCKYVHRVGVITVKS